MPWASPSLIPETDWWLLGLGAAALALAAGIGALLMAHYRATQIQRLSAALNNMSQGLCMFDANMRLIICNEGYLRLYKMTPDVVRPGATLLEILENRRRAGSFAGEPKKYIEAARQRIGGRKVVVHVNHLADGRLISVTESPMPDGSWGATHEDITEQRALEQQRATMQAHEERRTALESAINSFRERVESVFDTVGQHAMTMRSTATTLFGASDQTSKRAQGAVQSSNEASGNVRTAATAAEELSLSIAEISRQLIQANDIVQLAANEAQTTNAEISHLDQAAQTIGDVVGLIHNIAGQTNLLALNATIEAARAGDAGRGFAVVASEVKSLAVQTAKATEEIGSQIRAVQDSTSGAVGAIHRIAGRMADINARTASVVASVEQQNAATGEILQSVASAAKGTLDAVAVLQELAGAASDTRGSAETVLNTSAAVETAVMKLRAEVEEFLDKVAV